MKALHEHGEDLFRTHRLVRSSASMHPPPPVATFHEVPHDSPAHHAVRALPV
ncbi:MAG: hypothetical protein ACLFR7_11940 [Opitutales bacterium]